MGTFQDHAEIMSEIFFYFVIFEITQNKDNPRLRNKNRLGNVSEMFREEEYNWLDFKTVYSESSRCSLMQIFGD